MPSVLLCVQAISLIRKHSVRPRFLIILFPDETLHPFQPTERVSCVCVRCVMVKICGASLLFERSKIRAGPEGVFNIAKLKAGDGLNHQKSPWLLRTEILVLASFCKGELGRIIKELRVDITIDRVTATHRQCSSTDDSRTSVDTIRSPKAFRDLNGKSEIHN